MMPKNTFHIVYEDFIIKILKHYSKILKKAKFLQLFDFMKTEIGAISQWLHH